LELTKWLDDMDSTIDAIKIIFRTSFNLRLLLLGVIAMLIILAASWAFGMLAGLYVVFNIGIYGLEAIIPSIIIALSVTLVVTIILSAFAVGGFIFGAHEVLLGKKPQLNELYIKSLERLMPATGVVFVMVLIQLIVLILTFLPFLPGTIEASAGIDFNGMVAEIGALGADATNMEVYDIVLTEIGDLMYLISIWFLLYSIVLFLIEPFFVMFLPFALIGGKGTLESVKENFKAAKINYLQILLILVPVFVVGMVISIIALYLEYIGIILSIYIMVLAFVAAVKIYHMNTVSAGKG